MKGKFLTIFLLLLLSFSACSSNSKEEDKKESSNGLEVYETSEFSIQYPRSWEILTKKDFTSDISQSALAAFRNIIKNSEFIANIVVYKYKLPNEISSLDYAKSLIAKHKTDVKNFRELDRKEIKIKTDSKEFDSLFVFFENDKYEFKQISVVKKKTAYIVTGAFLKTEDKFVKELVEDSLKTFSLR